MKRVPQPKGLKGPKKIARSTVQGAGLNRSRIKSLGLSKGKIKALSRGKVKKISL